MNNILSNSDYGGRTLEGKQVDPKLERGSLIKADSDDIDINALLKAVIDISDRLQSQEEKLSIESKALREREKNFSNRGRRLRPDTAVLRYHEGDDSESLSGSDVIDGDKCDELASDSAMSPLKRLGKLQPLLSEHSLQRYSRKNMSFSNDKVTHIDQENQRLLKEILQSKTSLHPPKRRGPDRVASSATVNRTRRQEQIERENAALLRRLETVKATPTLRRENLLREHIRSEMHARRISKSSLRPSSASSLGTVHEKSSSESCGKNSDTGSVASSSKLSVTSRASTARSRSSNPSRKSATPGKKRIVTVWEPGW